LTNYAFDIRFSGPSLPTKLITGNYEIMQAIISEPATKRQGLVFHSVHRIKDKKVINSSKERNWLAPLLDG
jgi:hypothetical protein